VDDVFLVVFPIMFLVFKLICPRVTHHTFDQVDDVFLVVFPIMFLVFNLIYWPMCLSARHSDMEG
jgi:hypothetical protein